MDAPHCLLSNDPNIDHIPCKSLWSFGAYFLCCHLLYITPICLFQWMAPSSTLQRAPQSLPSFSECRYTRLWHPCFSTITGPLVRFWRVWEGDIFGLKVCIPLQVVTIVSCRLNDYKSPHQSASLPSHHNRPPGPLLEGLGRGYLQIEGVYSSRCCTHRFLFLKRFYTTP